jgi:hypothetical protein
MAQKKTTTKDTITSKSGITEDVILPYLYHSIKKSLAFRDRVVQDTVKITVHTDIDFRKMSIIFFDKNNEVITVGGISTFDHTIKDLLTEMGALNARITRFQLEPRAMNAVEVMIHEITTA